MPSHRLVVASRKGLLIFEERRGDWQLASESHGGAQVTYAAADPRDGALFACLLHGHWGAKLQRSRDSGRTWQEIPTPKYPDGAQLKEGQAAVLKYQWCLAFGPAQQPGRMYLGTVPGAMFVSDDAGDSFRLVEALWNHPSRLEQWFGGGMHDPGIHSVLIDPRNASHVLVGVSCAGVFETTDDGQSWRPRNTGLKADFLPNPDAEIGHDPHLVEQCRAQPDVLWQQNHCGIFRSINGGETWTNVSQDGGPAHFGFAIAVDPRDGDRAWVIPAQSDEVRVAVNRKLCVCRTDDGGQTWKAFRLGLPQQDCYDFAFRHALDLSEDRITFGTACGSLYISDDHGERWRAIANHLPPIYSVRFV